MMTLEELRANLDRLPFGNGYRFVDEIHALDAQSITGTYRFRESEWFFEHHFPDNPIVPGAILMECAVQIGLACFGMALKGTFDTNDAFVLTSQNGEFLAPVRPNDEVMVKATKVYWRFGKLRCQFEMTVNDSTVCLRGEAAGLLVSKETAKD